MAKRRRESTEPCIYCGSAEPRRSVEHVVSQALGTFEQNWTLRCVCAECNRFFGETFELVLGRDSVEGFIRVEAGIKPVESINQFLNRRAVFTLQNPGSFQGARTVMRAVDGRMAPDAPAQVAFRSEGGVWETFLEQDLTLLNLKRLKGPRVQIRILGGHGTEETGRLVRRLAELGLPFEETERAMDQPLVSESVATVLHEFTIDTTNRRAAAKIGFNYLARVLGCEIARRPDFDAIRRFVRYGEEPEPLVTAQEGSILVGPQAGTSLAHVCAFRWEPARKELIGIVSLFNRVTYGLRLCAGPESEWAAISASHVFDPVSRQISPLVIAE